ncbi:MAG: tRNA (uridine(34)/cytosine(34)/5-carboxymethylaminomethyluridine(34)-2'-O)-methyltransferase TrmL [Clostridia bacterium]|nr:tRNA (uridine(34)/cytosine(34)/5-carboxymethylaminomethyluridine(34)-2'-O)-methyltransferase TrmL [Clostridia bacterium]
MSTLNIVLVEPEIPQNTGNIARTCAATGARLHIVKPCGFTVDDRKLKRAGLDYWYLLDITYYENLNEFFEKNPDGEYYFFTTKARQSHSDVKYSDGCYLFFGKETKGLPEELLMKYPDSCVRIPMISDARSLNLSNSVAVGVYEALRQWDYPKLSNFGQLHEHKWEDIL